MVAAMIDINHTETQRAVDEWLAGGMSHQLVVELLWSNRDDTHLCACTAVDNGGKHGFLGRGDEQFVKPLGFWKVCKEKTRERIDSYDSRLVLKLDEGVLPKIPDSKRWYWDRGTNWNITINEGVQLSVDECPHCGARQCK